MDNYAIIRHQLRSLRAERVLLGRMNNLGKGTISRRQARSDCAAHDLPSSKYNLAIFCRDARFRSAQYAFPLRLYFQRHNLQQVVWILQQELDSLIRAIHLLSIEDHSERQKLIKASVNGEPWKVDASGGIPLAITNKGMAEHSEQFYAWIASVYRFGCAFIHLSALDDLSTRDPFRSLPEGQRRDILQHLQSYHGESIEDNASFADISSYFPAVFDEVSDNLEWYLRCLENAEDI